MKDSSYKSRDDLFIQKLTLSVIDNFNNDQFSVEHLSKTVNLSRSQLYRKLKHLKSQTVSQFIREVRLKEAMRLLEKDTATIAEIAFQVGFSSSAYFHKCFQDYFGITPGEARKSFQKEEELESVFLQPPVENAGKERVRSSNSQQDSGSFAKKKKNAQPIWRRKQFLISSLLILLLVFAGFLLIEKDLKSKVRHSTTIAILPLDFFSVDTDRGYLAKTIYESLHLELAKISRLNILSKVSTLGITRRNMFLPEIAQELQVDAVIEGFMLITDDSLWVKVQLIQAFPQEKQLWSEEYRQDISGEYPFQQKLVSDIVEKVRQTFSETSNK